MSSFDAFNSSAWVVAILRGIYRSRSRVSRLSGRGVTGAEAQSHHLDPMETLVDTDAGEVANLHDSIDARFLFLLDRQAAVRAIDPTYAFNGVQNIQVLPVLENNSFAPDLARHSTSNWGHTLFFRFIIAELVGTFPHIRCPIGKG